ncbi:MAG: DUF386 domain-containing protein [Ruminococcaceae bacterium]|nr:DUF386 domain-containing protein [Oscillospiraceae bacterium]
MIVDHIKNYQQYGFVNEDFEKVFDVLKTLDKTSPMGKIMIEEGRLWISIGEASERTSLAEFEAHKDFIDIHFLLSGKEEFGFANVDGLSVTIPYDPQNDVGFYKDNGISMILDQGYFCVVFPHDAHIPFKKKLGAQPLIRAVAKIKIK